MDKDKRLELDEVLRYAAKRGIPVDAQTILEIAKDDAAGLVGDNEQKLRELLGIGLAQVKTKIDLVQEALDLANREMGENFQALNQPIQPDELPLFTLTKPGAVPAPMRRGMVLGSLGWEKMPQPVAYRVSSGGGGGTILPVDAIGWLHNDGLGNLSWTIPAGGGDVFGPAGAVNNNFASYDNVTGKLIKDSGYNAGSFAAVLGVDDHYVTAAQIANFHVPVSLDANADTLLSLGTQTLGLDTQSAGLVFAGPASGVAAVPTFRALVATDIPALAYQPVATILTTLSGLANAAGVLTNDGFGALSWGVAGGVPGGVDTNVQYNDGGAFGGDANFTWNKTTGTLTLYGALGGANPAFIQGVSDGNSWGLYLHGGNSSVPNFPGGDITIIGGDGTGVGMGGWIRMTGGTGGDIDGGGTIEFTGGTGGSTLGPGGDINFRGGGAAAGNDNGGRIMFAGGIPNGIGLPGNIMFQDPISTIWAIFDTSLLATSDKTFTFPNYTGTFALGAGSLTATSTNDVATANHTHAVSGFQMTGYVSTAIGITLNATHHFVLVTAACTIALPPVAGLTNQEYIIKATADNVIVDGSGAETIDGETTQTLMAGDGIQIICDGATWWVV